MENITTKSRDRRKAFWASFIYVCISPLLVYVGLDAEVVKTSAVALTSLGIANYFSSPTGA